jgi:hypothetical protein
MILYAVTRPDWPEDTSTVIVTANGREQAKRTAKTELAGDPDRYIVEPLSPLTIKSKIIWRLPEFERGQI